VGEIVLDIKKISMNKWTKCKYMSIGLWEENIIWQKFRRIWTDIEKCS